MGAREGADERIGEDDAAHDIVVEGALDHLAERALDEVGPGIVIVDERAHLLARP
ncbi:unannotated protein [freshwater metagenome]|uniref:Unannotated protein n=1 Tax=freshwater metagenome TaxID=449393 RepID=A0A6J6TW13_9ZZZZ